MSSHMYKRDGCILSVFSDIFLTLPTRKSVIFAKTRINELFCATSGTEKIVSQIKFFDAAEKNSLECCINERRKKAPRIF